MEISKKKKIQSVYKKYKIEENNHERLNVISGFCFPFLTQFTKETSDEKHIISTGSYPSQVKCFSLEDLNLKFQRNFDSNITDFQILSKNWEKVVFLRSDRRLDFHTKSGSYYQIKIPQKGVDLTFDKKKLFLYITGDANYVSVLDFNEGKFLNPIQSNENMSITCSGISSLHGLIAIGTKNGKTEFWDPRTVKNCIGKVNGSKYTKYKKNNAVSSLRFSDSSENLFFSGFNSGEVVVYDLRCFSPLLSKLIDPYNPIKCIRANYDSNFVLTSNLNSINYWRLSTGKTKFFLKSKTEINHICSVKNTGLIFLSLNSSDIGVKYFKALGTTPQWAKLLFKEKIE